MNELDSLVQRLVVLGKCEPAVLAEMLVSTEDTSRTDL
jgi:hypothetical protein